MHRTKLLLACCVLSACGQKGPLYLPDEVPVARPYSACDLADAPCRRDGTGNREASAQPGVAPASPSGLPRRNLTLDPGSLPAQDTPSP